MHGQHKVEGANRCMLEQHGDVTLSAATVESTAEGRPA